MLISLGIFTSIFTYLECTTNKLKSKYPRRSYISPLLFILSVIGSWEFINLITFDLGVSYSLIFLLDVLLYSIMIAFFSLNKIIFFVKNKVKWKSFIYEIPLLLALLFIAIFFLFFYRKYQTYQTDMWTFYQGMHQLAEKGNNYISNETNLIFHYSVYIPVGIYQFGTALPLFQRFYLFPYFHRKAKKLQGQKISTLKTCPLLIYPKIMT